MSEAGAAIDPRAVVDGGARIGEGTTVGPYAVIGPDVTIGANVRIASHVVVEGPTTIGEGCSIHPFASIGGPPQDLKYRGEKTRLVIGARNVIRECCTFNRGTAGGGGVTTVGDENLFMTGAHVAHDCVVGSRTIFANAATLAGHVTVGDDTTIGAYSGIHQFCRIGNHAFIGGYSVITQDALPYTMTVGNRAKSHGINVIGLRRKNIPEDSIEALRKAYRTLFRSKLRLEDAIVRVREEMGRIGEVAYLLDFIGGSDRGVIR